jgi:hypothetical protein
MLQQILQPHNNFKFKATEGKDYDKSVESVANKIISSEAAESTTSEKIVEAIQELRKTVSRDGYNAPKGTQRQLNKYDQDPERYLENAQETAAQTAIKKYENELERFSQGKGGNQEDGSFVSPIRTDLDQMPVVKSEVALSSAKDKYAAERNSWTIEGREKSSDRMGRLKKLANNTRREQRILKSNQERTTEAKQYLTDFYDNAEKGIVKHEGSYYDSEQKATVIPSNNYNNFANRDFFPGQKPIEYAEALSDIHDSNQVLKKIEDEKQKALDKENFEKTKIEGYAKQTELMATFEASLEAKQSGTFLETQIRPKIFGEKVEQQKRLSELLTSLQATELPSGKKIEDPQKFASPVWNSRYLDVNVGTPDGKTYHLSMDQNNIKQLSMIMKKLGVEHKDFGVLQHDGRYEFTKW